MCHSDESRPPAAAGTVPARTSRELRLNASDGNSLLAHEARAAEPTGAGIVVLPDVRGLHAFYRELTERFAGIGVDAVAIDYFGRTADTDDRTEAFEFRPHVEQTAPESVAADVQAGVAHLQQQGIDRIYTVGFCFGGAYSWRQSADTPGLAGCIGFYGRTTWVGDAASRMRAPLLMLMGGADPSIPRADSQALADHARAAGVQVEHVVYDGAPHSFFDRSFAEHEQACADAWARIRAFVS